MARPQPRSASAALRSRTPPARARTAFPRGVANATRPLARARRKFLRAFPGGFSDETYDEWERNYKWAAHARWQEDLSQPRFLELLRRRAFADIASSASAIESRTNLLFSFEKMALRDAVRSSEGARVFAIGLYELLHG